MRSCGAVPLRTSVVAILILAIVATTQGQDSSPATPLTLVSRDGRRTVPTSLQAGREVVALDDVANLFQVSVKEDALAGGVTVSYRGRTIVASANRPMASVEGRVVSLPSPVVRAGRRWLVPIEFLSVALASIYDQRIELRRTSRLLIVGDVRLPRVTALVESPGPPTRASIDIAPSTAVAVNAEPGRLTVRIDADGLDFTPANAGGLIDRIRPGDQPNTIVVTLTDAAGTARSTVTTENNVARVLIEVPAGAASEARAPSPEVRPPTPESPTAVPDPRAALAAIRTWQTIVIDPGHGGDDVGVRGAKGAEEKQLTLDIARRLRTMVENRLGLRVILTRDDDRAIALDQRAAVANNGKANLLISLHVNGALVPEQAGAEIFHLQLDRESAEVVRVATAEGTALPTLGGGTRRLDLIPWDLAQARHLDESSVLASVLQEELQRQIPMSTSPVRQAPMRLLAAANMPAALIEVAYLTNPEQEARLNSDDFKTVVAQAVFSAIVRFRAWSEESQTP
ncbi:MAG TPA: N-acetylmuramoyl-L-alanine amidase [Vicinamibacterales bacterium]|nr:N-acetylmuramoyl-L-alanine amidase [Vicinamibacterales bacterium]